MNHFPQSVSDTIAALASAPGSAPRGILRISGPQAVPVAMALIAGNLPDIHPRSARRYECRLGIAADSLQLPACLFVWPTRRSFTGEPLVEIHCVGSPPLLNELLERIYTSGARPAERGEFTLRAFLAGRIDLVQAEAVLGVIDASSDQQLKTALDQLAGGISAQIEIIREELLLHLADLEAGLDFVEEDIDFVQRPEFLAKLNSAYDFLSRLIQQSSNRMQSTGHARVVLAGLPNAGKSTLFNALLKVDSAIVSPVPGTTRDYLTALISEENGLSYELVDTAGWETARDEIEAIASEKRHDQYQKGNLIVWCSTSFLPKEERELDKKLYRECREHAQDILRVQTKIDIRSETGEGANSLGISVFNEESIQQLRSAICAKLTAGERDSELIGSTAARCQESLQHAVDSLVRAKELVDLAAGDELVAMELRDVLEHLGRIVGAVYTDDILDRIFSRFCIGK